MKLLLLWLVILFVAVAQAQPAKTTVTDTIYDSHGNKPSGTISIFNAAPFISPDGFAIARGPIENVTVVNGMFTATLVPNIGSNPAGTSYAINYRLTNGPASSNYTATWVIPQSATPIGISVVQVAVAPTPLLAIAMTQVGPPAACLNPGTPIPSWTGVQWTCVSNIGSIGPGAASQISVFSSTTNAIGTAKLTFPPRQAKAVINPSTVMPPGGYWEFEGWTHTPLPPTRPNVCKIYYDLNANILKGITSTGSSCAALTLVNPYARKALAPKKTLPKEKK